MVHRAAWTGVKQMSKNLEDGEFDPSCLYNVIRMLVSVFKRFPHLRELVICADPVDERRSTWRCQHYPAYKKSGGELTDTKAQVLRSVRETKPWVRYLAGCLPRTTWFEDPFYEADDFMAYAAKQWRVGESKLIFSADRDILQLVDPTVQVAYPHNKDYTLVNVTNFSTEIGKVIKKTSKSRTPSEDVLARDAYLAWRCLVGDTRDNIPGLKEIAGKRGSDILRVAMKYTAERHPVPLWDAFCYAVDAGNREVQRCEHLVRINPDAKTVLDFGYYMMQLDGNVQRASKSFQGVFRPEDITALLQKFRFDSLMEGGTYHHLVPYLLGKLINAI